MRRLAPILTLAVAFAAAPALRAPARAEGDEGGPASVAAANGVVVHGVDRKLLAARLREADAKAVAGDHEVVAVALAELSSAEAGILVEEGEGVWLSADEAVLQRVAALPPDALARYRTLLDARAAESLAGAAARRDVQLLSRDAFRYAFTTPGARMLLLLADLRLARGELPLACRALEDLLRLLPEHAPPELLAAAASRLGALLATSGDGPGIRGLVGDLTPPVLDRPAPLGGPGTLRDELARAAALADRRSPLDPGPAGPLTVIAEGETSGSGLAPWSGRPTGTLRERPLPIGTPGTPVLLARTKTGRQGVPRVVALAPAPADAAAPGDVRRVPRLTALWQFPSSTVEPGLPGTPYPFAPVRLTQDLVAFAWPVPRDVAMERDWTSSGAGDEQHELIVLSISAEGKLVEERGVYESKRDDGDESLEQLSFAGLAAEGATSLYATAVRRAGEGSSTELHVCRFDLDPASRDGRLRLRWHRHVLDGRAMLPARFHVRSLDPAPDPVALPGAPLVRAGRVYVASNSGAVACLDATTGRPEWVETYDRFGPASRLTVREAELATWDAVPLFADGPYLYAAPTDAESLVQFRRSPRSARSVRIEDFVFAGPNGTSRRAGRILLDLVPNEVAAVRDGVAYLSGVVTRRPIAPSPTDGTPVAAFRIGDRFALHGEVEEFASAGTPALVQGGLLFPTAKAIYRIPTAAFDAPSETLWRHAAGGDPFRGPDRIGRLVPDGTHLWSVTPSRVLLLGPADAR